MSGWDLNEGIITEYNPSEEQLWTLFNFVFSDSCKKRNTYKYGFIKSLLDNCFNGIQVDKGIFYRYEELFARFAENYWNLVVKYNLRQTRKDGKSQFSKVEIIFNAAIEKDNTLQYLEFESIEKTMKASIVNEITKECKKYVIGALYEDFNGIIYEFDKKADGLILNKSVHDFMLKYKMELEKINYYSWAKFLEQINEDNVLVRVIDKLEVSTPHRSDLSVYRHILQVEFEENNCFYCGRKLGDVVHVDHFIPWSFIKDDKLWNFVLACPTCNTKKNNKIPSYEYLLRIENRNRIIQNEKDTVMINKDFSEYSEGLLRCIWKYAKLSGFKEMSSRNG